MEKRLYEIINPSDPITVMATPAEARVFAYTLGLSLYFLNDAEGNIPESYTADEWNAARDAIYADPVLKASFANVYRSALIGSPSNRKMFEEAIKRMTPADAVGYRAMWHDHHRSSMNDICARLWEAADAIDAYVEKETV
jgi:hypothetical protein